MRSFIHLQGGTQVPGFDLASALRDALDADGVAGVWDHPPGGELRLVFTLQRSGIATVVLAPDGRHLATYADSMRAVAHGFELLDRAAEQRSARPRQSRAGRRITTKAATP